jgi:hypothetical protein
MPSLTARAPVGIQAGTKVHLKVTQNDSVLSPAAKPRLQGLTARQPQGDSAARAPRVTGEYGW